MLTLLSKLIKIPIIYVSNWVRYWMYKIWWSLKVLALRLTSILASITNAEIVKSNTSFLVPY